MFIYSAKMDKRKLLMILVCLAVVVIALVLIFRGGGTGGRTNGADPYKEQVKLLKNSRLASTEDCITLLTSLGWEVNVRPLESRQVMIPEEFSPVYENYNELQAEQNLDLGKYKGKQVMRYTFEIVNYPSGEENVQATLLVYKNKLVGGDVCSARLDGFMHTLLMPEGETSNIDGQLPSQTDKESVQSEPPETEDAGIVTEEYQEVDYNDPGIYPTD